MGYGELTRNVHQVILRVARESSWFGRIFDSMSTARARAFAERLRGCGVDGSCLDVGCGTGHLIREMGEGGEALGVDVDDLRTINVPFVQADATNLPLTDKSFDNVLFVTVLHHIDASIHAAILAEAVRVARYRIVLLEDTFTSRREEVYMKAMDRVYNLDIGPHPHSNRSVADWETLLLQAGCRSVRSDERVVRFAGMPLRQAVVIGYCDEARAPSPSGR